MPQSSSTLQQEFNDLLIKAPTVFSWLTEGSLDGIWYCDLELPGKFWANNAFWKILGITPPEDQNIFDRWSMTINTFDKNKTIHLIKQCRENPKKEFNDTFTYIDDEGNEVILHSEGKVVFDDKNNPTRLIIKHFKERNIKQEKLLSKVKKLKKLRGILHETNKVAKVGGWEVDLVNQKITWTKVTKQIHEVDSDYKPELETAINFFEEGWSRDTITEAFAKAVETGKQYDVELRLITAKGNTLWVRTIGKPVFENGNCVRIYGAIQDISARKEQEAIYEETREKFEKIFNHSSIGIVLLDFDNKPIIANPASMKIFGFDKNDLEKIAQKNITLKDIIYPEDFEEATELRKKLLNGEINSYTIRSRFYKQNGELIWCKLNSSLIKGTENSQNMIISHIEDITEQKHLEETAFENSIRFRSAFEHSPNGMAMVGLDGTWLMVNKSLCNILGYTKDEFVKLTFQQITYKTDLDADLRLLHETLEGKRDTYSMEKRYLHKDGSIVYGLLNVSLIRDEENTPLYFISQINDITKRVKAKQELEASLKELQDLMNATTQVAIIEADTTGIVKKYNKGAETLLGYTAEEVIGKHKVGIFHDQEEVAKRSKLLAKKYGKELHGIELFTYNATRGEYDSEEWVFVKKDGSKFDVQLVITAIRDKNDVITGYVGIATDITQLKEMEKSLVSEKHKAEYANKSKSEFLANMSHEIRTPLNGVIGFTDLLMKTELNETQSKYMQMVNTSAHSLLDLINDILDFSKIEAGKLELSEDKTDLIELCSQTVDIIKHDAHEKGLELLLDISPKVKRFIYADSIRLRQILVNLLGNAIKFTEKGEVELKVRNTPYGNNENEMLFEFSIRDTGIGIAPHNLQKIFNAFDQEDASTTRKYGGTGLGITISNRLLELMDSKLEVVSELNNGSTFSFKVRFKTEFDDSYPEKQTENVNNVLIVDDNENNLTILKDMLAFGKVNSVSAQNGIQALEILENKNDFDLAIIDFNMPYLNGLELISHIRKKLKIDKEALPIILLHSSVVDSKILQLCKELDVKFEVTKPIRIDQLFDLISNIKIDSNGVKEVVDDSFTKNEQGAYNILIAEDNPVNQFLAKTIIQKVLPQANITIAEDGEKAVKMYQSMPLDLIFMDIQMPVMSGFDATKEIRQLEDPGFRIPIIALTARALKGERERCLDAGMDDYITKPIIFETIKETIKLHLPVTLK
ncbi:PAS domain-containing hybrid sensor histidine kinase/response regulator [Flavobacterium beibuense]|uniref:histidine kinase n=1 Tax=Flavobacterium beibuense TaxID=657326 RepID=A0A444W3G3_9FLAO|nr:PAS domain-containing hybrid sensor histidine kinase/response regulator [Flavobacterium beibuense]RYJ40430.1 Two-component system sensor histidine kinase/response regulator hybrid [Flavobacterium beibuense]